MPPESAPRERDMGVPPEATDARALDTADPLAGWRERFHIPSGPDGSPLIYFAGHSLGLQPRSVADAVREELEDWARLGVAGHFAARTPWYTSHERLREAGARLVGARPDEVVFMNGLTVNLHLMLVSFYRPTRERYAVLMEDCAFPSDTYAVQTQMRLHGVDPAEGLIVARPRAGEHTLRTEDVEALLEREGGRIALVLFGGVNYFTGQYFDVPRITRAARRAGCTVGWDLAHAVGNVPLRLHDWDVDFAVWCCYKYLNGGPGAVGGCFVHERHARGTSLPRFGGWWGNDPRTRFRMHLEAEFVPVASADGWQLSNPPILSLAAVRAALAIFDEAGMDALRAKSERLTAYLCELLDGVTARAVQSGARAPFEVITPRDPAQRGNQVSIVVRDRPQELERALREAGVVCDFRPPNVVRVAPVPLYNTFEEVGRFAELMARHAGGPVTGASLTGPPGESRMQRPGV